MVLYRRNRLAGGTFFFTVTLRDRRSRWLTEYIGDLRQAYQQTQKTKPFETVAIAILPDHLHAIWKLPAVDADYSGRWRSIKAGFTRSLVRADRIRRSTFSGGFDLWQSRFWEHTIRGEADLQRHVDYIHFNPVKHGLVARVADWPHSSFHRYALDSKLPADWGGNAVAKTETCHFGE